MEKLYAAHCPNCFCNSKSQPCPDCGWRASFDNPPPALAMGRVLDGRYRIGRVLGHGGFGITYLAWDDNLQLRLAIKEYLPRDCAGRAPDGLSLAVYFGPAGEQFAYGLDRFLEEARALAHFDQHPGIVTVKNFFRAHGTGYCVMDYVDGITLRDYLEQQPGGRISSDAALKLLMPVIDALRAVHKEGQLHRDIAPDNIYLTQDGRIKLLDFGAARFAAGEHSKSLSIILKPGYAPEEQYRTRGHQGPWTDVYGLAATLYRAITGQVPPEALDRLDTDELVPPSKLGVAIRPEQETDLLKGLAVKARDRYQSMAELQQALQIRGSSAVQPASVPLEPEPSRKVSPPRPTVSSSAFPLVLGGILLLLFAILGLAVWHQSTTGTIPPILGSDPAQTTATPEPSPAATPMMPATSSPATAATPAPPPEPSPVEMGKSPIYFAAELAPTDKIPPEAPLCYKFMVAGPEEQLKKLKNKYSELYDEKIQKNPDGSKTLVAKRKDGKGKEIVYFYTTNPMECNEYQKNRIDINMDNNQRVSNKSAAQREDLWKLADNYFNNNNYIAGINLLQPLIQAGDSEVLLRLGSTFIGRNSDESTRWYRMAANQLQQEAEKGNKYSSYTLAGLYEWGLGVAKDAAIAEYWYRKSADQGNIVDQKIPTREYQCVYTTVKEIGTRLLNIPGSGTSITFNNDIYLVRYDSVQQAEMSRKNDKVKICLMEVPKNCPPGDERGKAYTVINLRTNRVFNMADSSHVCGGA